jgi:hypothetical protein
MGGCRKGAALTGVQGGAIMLVGMTRMTSESRHIMRREYKKAPVWISPRRRSRRRRDSNAVVL